MATDYNHCLGKFIRTFLRKIDKVPQNLSENIENLSQEIVRKEKLYALALKMGKNKNVLDEMLSDIDRLKTQLHILRDTNRVP